MDKVAIVIVNWNTGTLLAKCLASVQNIPDRSRIDRVIVVDNASWDSSIAEARAVTGEVPVYFITLKHNIGFARANNKAITHVREKLNHHTHVLLLNPDTVVTPQALTALLDALAEYPRAGIIGPQLQNPDASLQPSVRGFPTLPVLLVLFLKLSRFFPKVGFWRRYLALDFDYTRPAVVDQVMGAAFLIRHDLLASRGSRVVGLLDERYFVWFEEVDYCRRAKAQGWEVRYTPHGVITHYGGASFGQLVGWRRVAPFVRSALVYTRSHLSRAAWILLLLLVPVTYVLSFPAALVHLMLHSRTNRYVGHAN